MCSIFPKEILDLTIELFHPRTVLDVGCGTGISLDYFMSKGIAVRGLEGSALAISKARHAALIQQHDLNAPLDLGKSSTSSGASKSRSTFTRAPSARFSRRSQTTVIASSSPPRVPARAGSVISMNRNRITGSGS